MIFHKIHVLVGFEPSKWVCKVKWVCKGNLTLLHFLRRSIYYGSKNPWTNFLFGVIRSVSKSISERQTSLQKCGQPFPRGSNPAGLLRFHKIHDLVVGFEPCRIFRQNPVFRQNPEAMYLPLYLELWAHISQAFSTIKGVAKAEIRFIPQGRFHWFYWRHVTHGRC